jgi:hypothetical protein
MHPALRLRQAVNVLNLSTPLGLLVAKAGRATLSAGPDGLVLARGYRLGLPRAPAFTVGNLVVLRIDDETLARRPGLLVHEGRHSTQYAVCVGPLMLPLYLLASGLSWLRCRDFAWRNVFEVRAGLEDGGYRPPTPGSARPTRVA